MAPALQGLIGVALIPLVAFLLSECRHALGWRRAARIAAITIAIQAGLALLLLKVPHARRVLEAIGGLVDALQKATDAGTTLVFGYLAGGPAPFAVTAPANSFVLGIRALPIILVLSALAKLFYHWGVLQRVVKAFAFLLARSVGTSGPLGTVSAANVFLGPVEAPLLVRPYLAGLGRGALLAAMAVSMATIAGTVMALYATVLAPHVPGAAGHLLAASIMNVPAALMLSRLAAPTGFDIGAATAEIALDDAPRSSMDAITQGTIEGVRLVVMVGAMLIVIVALVALANEVLALMAPAGVTLTLQGLLGVLCAPLAWLIGLPWQDALVGGRLLGEKLVLNELVAYLDLASVPAEGLQPRSRLVLTYALCGFANLGSLGIMVGGLTTMLPSRREEIVALAPKAVAIGFLASLLSAAVIGVAAWE
ncbi:MAG: nucleoside transporter C-terminal domain-containing protein [Pseudomonadota bacterium]